MQENEETQKIISDRLDVPNKIEIEGCLVTPCTHYPGCNSYFKKIVDVHRHAKYHDDLKLSAKNVPDFSSFPCFKCEKVFPKYRDLRIHEDSTHPKFQYPCRFCDKIYNTRQNVSTVCGYYSTDMPSFTAYKYALQKDCVILGMSYE